jgi:hypothetical protein
MLLLLEEYTEGNNRGEKKDKRGQKMKRRGACGS